MMFTSGTAGPPRAAMLSHGNLLANIEQTLSVRDETRPDDVVYGVLPLFHIFGLTVVLGVSFTVGATRAARATVRPGDRGRVDRAAPGDDRARGARRCGWRSPTSMPSPTTRSRRSGSRCRAPSRLPTAAAEQFERRFGVTIREGYGLTEASPVVTSSTGMPVRLGSVGRVLVGEEVRLVGDDGEDVPPATPARSGCAGPTCSRATGTTRRRPPACCTTAGCAPATSPPTDDDGYLYLVDRAKDLIIVSGFNVYPGRGRGGARRAPCGRRGGGDRRAPPAPRRGGQGLRRAGARGRRRRGGADRPLHRLPGALQVPERR